MKIGILTFHSGTNYGGVLQCYAMQQLLLERGHEPEIINYEPAPLGRIALLRRGFRRVHSWHTLTAFMGECYRRFRSQPQVDPAARRAIREKFDSFRRERLRLSPPLTATTLGAYANAHYDAIIVGSDQVWTSLYDEQSIYFMEWQPEFRGRRLSYAACSAHASVAPGRRARLSTLLGKFDAITVRDRTTAQLVESLTGQAPPIVPDPTVLWPFREMVTDGGVARKPYILTYILGGEIEGGHAAALERIRQLCGGPVEVRAIVIPSNNQDIVPLADHVHYALRPEEWVDLFANAAYVYTDSFHAVMFSLKFARPFTAYYRDAVRSSRLIDLKERWHLDCVVPDVEGIKQVRLPQQLTESAEKYLEILGL